MDRRDAVMATAERSTFQIVDEVTRERRFENPFRTVQRKNVGEGLAEHSLLVSKDGAEKSIEDSSAPIRDTSGNALGVVLVFRDITARRIAESELERWKQIFSGAGFGMFVADSRTGVILDMNPTFAAMHGYSVNELLGTRLYALIPQHSHDDFAQALRIASEKSRNMFEHQHLRQDGTEFPSLVDVTEFRDGRAEFLAGYCSDITERKRFEDALRESEERFRTLASALPQLVWSTDAQGGIEYVNQGFGFPTRGGNRARRPGNICRRSPGRTCCTRRIARNTGRVGRNPSAPAVPLKCKPACAARATGATDGSSAGRWRCAIAPGRSCAGLGGPPIFSSKWRARRN